LVSLRMTFDGITLLNIKTRIYTLKKANHQS
jgi:hypothetical protein